MRRRKGSEVAYAEEYNAQIDKSFRAPSRRFVFRLPEGRAVQSMRWVSF